MGKLRDGGKCRYLDKSFLNEAEVETLGLTRIDNSYETVIEKIDPAGGGGSGGRW